MIDPKTDDAPLSAQNQGILGENLSCTIFIPEGNATPIHVAVGNNNTENSINFSGQYFSKVCCIKKPKANGNIAAKITIMPKQTSKMFVD